jgi:hypothetical protein
MAGVINASSLQAIAYTSLDGSHTSRGQGPQITLDEKSVNDQELSHVCIWSYAWPEHCSMYYATPFSSLLHRDLWKGIRRREKQSKVR